MYGLAGQKPQDFPLKRPTYVGKYSLHGAQWGGLLPDVELSWGFPIQLLGGETILCFSLDMSGLCQHSAIMSVGMLLCGNHTQ